MKYLLFIVALVISAPVLGQAKGTIPATASPPPVAVGVARPAPSADQASSNPWDIVPAVVPYRNLADALKENAGPGQPSPLNPTCEGMTGEACVRSSNQPER